MQLVEVWLQVAMLLAGSMAPAFLYGALRRSRALVDHWHTRALRGGLGLAGLAAVALFGRPLLALVYGHDFAGGHGYLVAGFAAAALGFVDQFVQVSITANNRPGVLAVKWGTACAVALAVLVPGSAHIGAYAGPAALAAGFVAGWLAVAVAYRVQHRRSSS
jgi:PST family polysaccharide transporter